MPLKSGTAKLMAAKTGPGPRLLAFHAEACGETARRHDRDAAARQRDIVAVVFALRLSRTGEGEQHGLMRRRIGGDDGDVRYAARAVRMLLVIWVPKILGKVLLAGREANLRRTAVRRERKREADLHAAAVRPLPIAFKMQDGRR